MANKRIPELNQLSSAANDDLLVIYDFSSGVTKYVKFEDVFPAGNDGDFEWNNQTVYAVDEVVTYQGKWWQSQVSSNQGNVPIEGANWNEVSKPAVVIIRPWVTGDTFTASYSTVRVGTNLYGLKNTTALPFVSTVSPDSDPTNWEALGASDAANVNVDNTGRVVITDATDQEDYNNKNDAALLKARGTEVLSITGLSINADPTKFDLGAITGQIYRLDGYYPISYVGATAIPVTDLSVTSIFVYINTLGVVSQQTTVPTAIEFREKLFIARLVSNGTILIAFQYLRNPSGQYSNSSRDISKYLTNAGVPLIDGLEILGNANLTFSRSAGFLFRFGVNESDVTPNEIEFNSVDPATFFVTKRDSTISVSETLVPVTQYDLNGTLTAITNNKFVAHRIYFFPSGGLILQYGQFQYNSILEAKATVNSGAYVINPANVNGEFLGWWIVQEGATSLIDPVTSEFLKYSIGGQSGGAVAGTLLAANNLSDVASAATSRTNLDVYSKAESDALGGGGGGGTLKAGNPITFDGANIYNSATALTGNITFDFTGAVIGTKVVVRHNDSIAPTLPAEVVYLGGDYKLSTDNYINFIYVSNSIVYYYFSESNLALLDPIDSATEGDVLLVDSLGRINQNDNFQFTEGGGLNVGASAVASTFARFKNPSGFSYGLSVSNNGDAFMFRVGSDSKIRFGADFNNYLFPTSTGSAIDNAGKGIAFNATLGSSNVVAHVLNSSAIYPVGGAGRNAMNRIVGTLTATAGSGGNEIAADYILQQNQVTATVNTFFTGRIIVADFNTSVTGVLNEMPIFRIRNSYLGVGLGATAPTAYGDFAASAAAASSLRLRTGVAPTTPNDGDIWQDGTDLLIRINGVTYTLNKTAV